MGKASATETADRVPIDHLLEASGRLVEQGWLDGGAEDQATDGHDADNSGTAKQADSRGLGCVTQRAEGCEGADQEVAVCHADLDAALPRFQAITVESHRLQELSGKETVGHWRLDLITSE